MSVVASRLIYGLSKKRGRFFTPTQGVLITSNGLAGLSGSEGLLDLRAGHRRKKMQFLFKSLSENLFILAMRGILYFDGFQWETQPY